MKNYKRVKIFIGDELYNEYKLNKINDNKFEYLEEATKNIIDFIDDNIIIKRENEEFLIVIESKKEEALYTLKELNYELSIQVNYFDSFVLDDNLIIGYQLETNDKAIKLVLEGE